MPSDDSAGVADAIPAADVGEAEHLLGARIGLRGALRRGAAAVLLGDERCCGRDDDRRDGDREASGQEATHGSSGNQKGLQNIRLGGAERSPVAPRAAAPSHAWLRWRSSRPFCRPRPANRAPRKTTCRRTSRSSPRSASDPRGRPTANESRSSARASATRSRSTSKTNLVRLLTRTLSRTPGLLRVQFLPNGDYCPHRRAHFTRHSDDALSGRRAVDHEGRRERAARAARPEDPRRRRDLALANAHRVVEFSDRSIPNCSPNGESVLYVADIAYDERRAAPREQAGNHSRASTGLHDRGAGLSRRRHEARLHLLPRERQQGGRDGRRPARPRAITTYRKVPDEYNEAEGVSPDGE